MQIVIEIDDDMYKSVVNNDAYVLVDVDWILLENAIANGIPLPKGHGRLIDEKDLSLMTVHMIDGMFVCDAPTIIEGSDSE
jgi:hypothetical protein